MKKRIFGGLLVICMLMTMVGCNKKEGQSDGSSVTEVNFFLPSSGKLFKEDDPVIAEVEKKTNTKINLNLVNANNLLSDFSILVASGDVPDVAMLHAFDFYQFVDQDIFLELDELIDKYGQNIKKAVGEERAHCWDTLKTDGKLYAIPKVTSAGKYLTFARQDWLDRLNMKVPETIDEYAEMVKRFTTDDPDGNGKNDTFGMSYAGNGSGSYTTSFSHIFGAFGMQPDQYMIKDNKLYATSLSEEYKKSIEFIAKLYKDKYIDPEIFVQKLDQGRQKAAIGKYGSTVGWWSLVPEVLMQQWNMKEINPDAQWAILPALKGENGEAGFASQPEIQTTLSISKETKNPVAVIKLIDYLSSEEGWYLANKGIADVHYDSATGVATEAGIEASTEKWLGALGIIMSNVAIQEADWEKTTPDKWTYIKAAKDMPLYDSDMYGIVTDEYNTLYPDIKKLQEEWFVSFVTGKESVKNFDKYVAAWEKKGGLKMLQSMADEYNRKNGTKIEVAPLK